MGWYTVIVMILIIHKIINLIFYPLKYTSPALGLLFTSLLTALLILTIFRLTSNQKKIKWAKDKVKAYILEIRLYRDQPRVILKALGNILLFNSMYLRYVLVPFLFIFIPVIFIMPRSKSFLPFKDRILSLQEIAFYRYERLPEYLV